jgi:FMN phosphatase YigB (HAD superfamily)
VFVAEQETRRQALLVDLDGTLYRGNGPVIAYANAVANGLPEQDRQRFLSAVDANNASGVPDGWEAVGRAAQELGVDRASTDRAFMASREALAKPDCVVEVPSGFIEALATLRPYTFVMLATNSPELGVSELLTRIGAADSFDEIVFGAKKPSGMPDLLARIADRVDAAEAPWRILSVGDHWPNDIEPALAFGAATAFVDRHGRADVPADVTGPTVEQVLPAIMRWAVDPDAFRNK